MLAELARATQRIRVRSGPRVWVPEAEPMFRRPVQVSCSTQALQIVFNASTVLAHQAGDVILGHLDDQWMCGDLQIETVDSRLTGPFSARIVR